MDSGNGILALKALDGLATRALVTAQNIANAGTDGYRPSRVTFENALRRAASGGEAAIGAVEPRTELIGDDPLSGAGTLRLDSEMEAATATALRYGALVTMLGRGLQLEALAVRGTGA